VFELAPAIVELGAIAICIGLILTRKIWVASFGALLTQLAAWIRATPSINLGFTSLSVHFLADYADAVNEYALSLLGAAIGKTEWAAKKLWHEIAYWVEAQGHAVEVLADDTYGALRQLRRWTVPYLIASGLKPLQAAVAALQAELKHLNIHPTTIIRQTIEASTDRIDGRARLKARLDLSRAGGEQLDSARM